MSTKIKIIAEIGINHNGSFEAAKKLIQASKNANIHAVKFQYRNLETSYSAYADREIGDEILIAQIKENYLSPEKLLELASFAHDLNLEVGVSVFDSGDIYDFGNGLKLFDFFKLPSAELTNHELIDSFIKTKKHLYISTGAHSEIEIERALKRLPKIGWNPLHCVSNYPLKVENAKLGYIKFLQKKWNKEIGYSSHDENWEICLLAIANGATIIERHITLDKKDRGLDHSSSSTPEEFNKLSEIAKNYDFLNLGENQRSPNQGERLNRQNLGRSYFFVKNVKSGQKLSNEHIEYRTPFKGIGKCEVNHFIGKPILKNVNRGTSLSQSLFMPEEKVSINALESAKNKNISIPVRFHDYDLISRALPTEAFELHLSYEEALSINNANSLDKNNKYSIHLPDYINDSELIDPFSQTDSQKELSFSIINKVVKLAEQLQNKTGTIVPIVGSFSIIKNSKLEFYEKIAELITEFKLNDAHIFPQWLPPIAWYFGGSVSLNSFCSEEDLSFIDELQIPICMDFCHLFMGASYFNFHAEDVLKKLKPLIKHVHLSEASGFDGEGMQFGEGDPGQTKIIGEYLDIDCIKVIEVWQGHLDQGAGFRLAIERLQKFYG